MTTRPPPVVRISMDAFACITAEMEPEDVFVPKSILDKAQDLCFVIPQHAVSVMIQFCFPIFEMLIHSSYLKRRKKKT